MRHADTHNQPPPTRRQPAPPRPAGILTGPSNGPDLRSWTRRWGTPDEVVLVACDEDGAERLNHFARTALRAAGRIGGPSVTAGRLDVAAGDRVVIGTHSAGGPALRPGGIADVRLVDPDGAWVVLDLPTAGTVRLSGAALERAGLHYAYAVVLPARRVTGRLHAVSPAHLGPELDLG